MRNWRPSVKLEAPTVPESDDRIARTDNENRKDIGRNGNGAANGEPEAGE